MPTWKWDVGEDAIFEGTVLFATLAGATVVPYDLSNATLTWHFGSTLQPPMLTRESTGSNFTLSTVNTGVYQFNIYAQDTRGFVATSYYFDIWLKTSGNRLYCLTVGTAILHPTVGTI